ncbi:hypothetical protein [Microtetraspora sp. NBRC 16547]|uniref:hypothetical protein n=1 Tax=Microtetraspora sp. NBRC 16547 TaxID=3030993 RepID=UPI0025527EBA|nr:hypothetical protein [Microtetraspora sp. NBRC 16547]
MVGSLGGIAGALLGLRPTMWIMTGLLAPCSLILALSPMRSRRDLPVASEPRPAATVSGSQ